MGVWTARKTMMIIAFELNGQPLIALKGGPHFKFTEAISLVVNCKTQKEVDSYWQKLSAGGKKVQCGWLQDRYGLSWRIVPTLLDFFGAFAPAGAPHRSPEQDQFKMRP